MTDYQHTTDVIALPPRKIAAHLRNNHGVEPKAVRKGYERGNWSWQHECLHKDAPGGTDSTVAGRQASPGGTVAYHHAPRRFRASILRHGIDWQRSGENHSLDYCRGNYLWSNLAVALDDLESVDDEPRDVWRIDVSGFVLLPDPEQVWERAKGYWDGPQSAWLTIEPIAPNRITLLDRQEAGFTPGGENLSESTLAFDVGIDYDAHMICPWCGEADPGETSGITTCCAEAVIGPAEAQLAKGAK